MSAYGAQPGLVFTPDYQYDPRWSYGCDGTLRIISLCAAENIPAGCLVQSAGPGLIQIARDGTQLAGVVCYDPSHYQPGVVYTPGDMVPVVRRGQVFVMFQTLQPPFASPGGFDAVHFYAGAGQGIFTTDVQGTLLSSKMCFSFANKDYYQTSDGSPAADDPYPTPPIPIGVQDTTFGDGVALVEVNLG